MKKLVIIGLQSSWSLRVRMSGNWGRLSFYHPTKNNPSKPCHPGHVPSGQRLQKAIEMAIEIVDLPIKNCDFPYLPGRVYRNIPKFLKSRLVGRIHRNHPPLLHPAFLGSGHPPGLLWRHGVGFLGELASCSHSSEVFDIHHGYPQ